MKCKSCGNEMGNEMVCSNCGFDRHENKRIKKILNEKEDLSGYNDSTDLLDYPILAFVLGILSVILPIFLFSFLALRLAKSPAKESYEPLKNVGRTLAYIGFGVSTIFVLYLLFIIFK